MEKSEFAVFFTGVFILLFIIVLVSAAAWYTIYRLVHSPHSLPTSIPPLLAHQLPVHRMPDYSLSAEDAQQLPSYAEAACSPVHTIINMEQPTIYMQERATVSGGSRGTNSIPPPYEPSTYSSISAAEGIPPSPTTPARPAPSRLPSGLRMTTIVPSSPELGCSVALPRQAHVGGLRSRVSSSVRLAGMGQGHMSAGSAPLLSSVLSSRG